MVGGEGPIFPLAVHQPASLSIWPAVQLLRQGLFHKSRDKNVGAVEEMICVVYVSVTEGD